MRLQDIAKRTDIFMTPVDRIKADPGFNPRNMTSARTLAKIAELENEIEGRSFDADRPLLGYTRDEDFIIIDGHCRHQAVRNLIARGHEIIALPCRVEPKGTSPSDRKLLTLRAPGDGLDPLDMADAIKWLLGSGWDENKIAAKLGRTRQWVMNALDLAAAPEPIKAAVNGGRMSATEAVRSVRRDPDPVATLQAATRVAEARGSAKVRPKDIRATREAVGPQSATLRALAVMKEIVVDMTAYDTVSDETLARVNDWIAQMEGR